MLSGWRFRLPRAARLSPFCGQCSRIIHLNAFQHENVCLHRHRPRSFPHVVVRSSALDASTSGYATATTHPKRCSRVPILSRGGEKDDYFYHRLP